MSRRPSSSAEPREGWLLVYDLSRDHAGVEKVQKASRDTEDFGFPTQPALFGSQEWWSLIDAGVLPAHVLEGEITQVYWGSMADWPEFRLRTADGSEYSLTREGDIRRYVDGLRAQVRRVELERKPSQIAKVAGPTANVVLSILLEESNSRSPAIAPGPGGHGYARAGGAGSRVFYFWLPTPSDAVAIAAIGEAHGERARTWDYLMGGSWVSVTTTGDVDPRPALTPEVVQRGGRYDGYEVVPMKGESAKAYGPLDL